MYYYVQISVICPVYVRTKTPVVELGYDSHVTHPAVGFVGFSVGRCQSIRMSNRKGLDFVDDAYTKGRIANFARVGDLTNAR